MLKNTIIIGIVLILLGGFYYFYEYKGAQKRESARQAAQQLFNVDQGAITKLSLKGSKAELTCVKENNAWSITTPYPAEAAGMELDNLMSQLLALTNDRSMEVAQSDWSKYGLQTPAYTLTFTTPKSTYNLWIGNKNPLGDAYYVRTDSGKVYMINTGLSYYLDKAPEDYRLKSALDFDPEALESLNLIYPDHSLKLSKQGGIWKMTEPQAVKADIQVVQDLSRDLRECRTAGFPAAKPQGTPVLTVQLKLQNTPGLQELKIFALDPKTRQYPAVRSKFQEVLLLPEDGVKKLFVKPGDFIVKRVLDYNDADAAKLDIMFDRKTITAKKDKAGWKITEPRFKQKQDAAIAPLMAKFKALKYKEMFTPENLAVYGLTDSLRSVSLSGKDDKVILKLVIGKQDKDFQWLAIGKGPEAYKVNLSDWNPIETEITKLFSSPVK